MPRPNPLAPGPGQGSLFPAPTTGDDMRHNRGRHQTAFSQALDIAYDQGLIDSVDGALASTLMAGAWSLDSFESQNKPYGPSKIVQPILDALRAAHMTPDTRPDTTDDAISQLVAELSAAEDSEEVTP